MNQMIAKVQTDGVLGIHKSFVFDKSVYGY